MNRDDILPRLTTMYLNQTMGERRWGQPNYENVMESFSKSPDGDITNIFHYMCAHDLPFGTSLRDLYHMAAKWRAFDYYKDEERPVLKKESPYSVEMLLRS